MAGRPTSYREEYVDRAEEYARVGATNAEMAEAFGVAESTFYAWQNEYPEFAEALKRGKLPADTTVANALYEKATGAEWVEEQAIKVKTVQYENGKRLKEEERVEVVEVTRRAPPDTTAIIFWLKNRRSTDWRDKQEIDNKHTVADPLQELLSQIADNGHRVTDKPTE